MLKEPIIEIRIGKRELLVLAVSITLLLVVLLTPQRSQAQKSQETFKDKFKIASDTGGIAIAVSSDGKFVYVAGPNGILVSDDFGKTGSWVETAQLK
jgi:hypothetical protein